MRLLFLTILAVSAVLRYGSCSPNRKLSSQSMLGRALLRRALEAMSNSPRTHIKRRSLDEEDVSGDNIKQTDAVEDISVGSGSHSEESGDSSGTRSSEINEDQSGSEEQSDISGNSAGSSGDGGAHTDEQTQGTRRDIVEASGQGEAENTEKKTLDQQEDNGVSSGSDTVEASGQKEPEETEDQQEVNSVSSGSDTVEAASDTQTSSPASGSSGAPPSDDAESGIGESAQETNSNSDQTSPAESTTVQVADSDKQTEQEPKKNASDEEVSTKKSTIAKVQPSALVAVKEDTETSASSGESDEVTSGIETSSGEASGAEDDGSAEAIRKGMESLSKLLKPVANGLDFQLFSGAAKPEDEDEDEEEKPISKAEGKGESDKAEEEKPRVVKVKKCETKCALPMTYDQCAVPRCDYKMGTIKDLCLYLCKHQKPVCKQECRVVE
ncbi:chondroitin proteoglycan 4-like [Actinia tenebrosa]|uniref:Chondroitin proteoglycan 4-like n=1 Tax=Actinia tenebrosa TaxID=6105 RepID=A0A6P8IG77_ACTTE|nr:chondroitin proteoglycan 4-like [Actinia tenebrosa]